MLTDGFTQAGVDWKYYGGASVDGLSMCFYDANGVVQEPGNQIRVWTKCLSQEASNHVDNLGKMTEDAAEKIIDGYVPPIVVAGIVNFDHVDTIVTAEAIADADHVKPQTRILYEIGCSERMIHELSAQIETKGKVGSSDKATDWRYVAPETSGAWLLTILCPK